MEAFTTNDGPDGPLVPPIGDTLQITSLNGRFEAVRVPAYLGRRALDHLGDASGAVIDDPGPARLTWLAPLGTSRVWDGRRLRMVDVLAGNAPLVVPPAGRTSGPGPHWRIPVSHQRCLTDPVFLNTVLVIAVQAVLGPRCCARCGTRQGELLPTVEEPGTSEAPVTTYLCYDCASGSLTCQQAYQLALEHSAGCASCRADPQGCPALRRLMRLRRILWRRTHGHG